MIGKSALGPKTFIESMRFPTPSNSFFTLLMNF